LLLGIVRHSVGNHHGANMPKIRCPKCDEKVIVPEDYDRPIIKCPSCGKKIVLDVDDDDDDDRPKKKPEPKPSGINGCLAIVGYTLAILLIFICIAVAFFYPGVAFAMAAVTGVLVTIVAGIAGMFAYFIAMGRGMSKLKAYAPWFGLMLLGLATWIGPLAALSIGQRAGWFKGPDDIAKGPDGDKGKNVDAKVDGGKKFDEKGIAPKDGD
jgi:DNA-directed RNA polymerase subunit RPC12/RpoP